MLYAMALGTGLREHELIGLDVGDVFRDGRPRRRLLLNVFKGAQRTGGTQEVLLSESLCGKLRRFHQWKARERESLDADAPLFVSRLGRRLSLRQVRHGFTVWQSRAGFERRVTFHMLRHSAVTNLYALTKDIRYGDLHGTRSPRQAHLLMAELTSQVIPELTSYENEDTADVTSEMLFGGVVRATGAVMVARPS